MTTKRDDRYFYTFDNRLGTYKFYMATAVDGGVIKARKCRVGLAKLGGTRGFRHLSWDSVGVFRFKPDNLGEELSFNKSEISGKAMCVADHIVSIPNPCLQET